MEIKGKVVAVTKRNTEGEPFSKQVHPAAIDLDKILNPSILDRTLPPVLSKPSNAETEKSKAKKERKTDEIGSTTERETR